MSLIDSMQMLKNDIRSDRQKRRQDFKAIREDTRELKRATHRMIADNERTRKEEAEMEERKLKTFTHDLGHDVAAQLKEFRQEQAEVKKEIAGASAVWHGKATVAVKEEKKEKKQKE